MPRIIRASRSGNAHSDVTMLHRLRELHRQTVTVGTHLKGESKETAAGNAQTLSWAITKIEGAKQ